MGLTLFRTNASSLTSWVFLTMIKQRDGTVAHWVYLVCIPRAFTVFFPVNPKHRNIDKRPIRQQPCNLSDLLSWLLGEMLEGGTLWTRAITVLPAGFCALSHIPVKRDKRSSLALFGTPRISALFNLSTDRAVVPGFLGSC